MRSASRKIQKGDWTTLLVLTSVGLFTFVSLGRAQQTSAPSAQSQQHQSFFEMVEESLLGDPTDPWRPLSLSTFLSEGWDESFDYPIDGSGGAPRQGWINALDGVFNRTWFLSYSHTHDFHHNGNQDMGSFTMFAPVNRRFQVRFDIPFFVSNKGGSDNTYSNNFGDVLVSPRFLLAEAQDFTNLFVVSVRTPTGDSDNGNDITSVTPQYEFWSNVTNGLVARGGIGSTLPTQDNRGRYTFNYNFGVGQYLTPHTATPFGDFVLYVAMDGFTTLDNRASDVTFFSFTPGFRSYIGCDWYLLGGVEVPVTGPPSESFDYESNVWVMKVW